MILEPQIEQEFVTNGIKEEDASNLIPKSESEAEDCEEIDFENGEAYPFNKESYEEGYVASVHEGKKHYCELCRASFNHRQSLKGHIAAVHEGNKPFICLICQKIFGAGQSLSYHMATFHEHIKVVHEGKKPFKSENCDDEFVRKDSLFTYTSEFHERKKLFSCEVPE